MTEAQGGQTTTAEKPANSKKLDHDMSMAPFLGVGKIEFEEVYKAFEDQMDEMEKNLQWMDFFVMAPELEKEIKEGGLVIVETKQYRALFTNKPGYESRKFRANDHHRYETKFYAWSEVIEILKLWKDQKFKYNLIVEPEAHCINRNFRHVKIFRHKKGFLVSNQFDMIYPEEIMKACLILGK